MLANRMVRGRALAWLTGTQKEVKVRMTCLKVISGMDTRLMTLPTQEIEFQSRNKVLIEYLFMGYVRIVLHDHHTLVNPAKVTMSCMQISRTVCVAMFCMLLALDYCLSNS